MTDDPETSRQRLADLFGGAAGRRAEPIRPLLDPRVPLPTADGPTDLRIVAVCDADRRRARSLGRLIRRHWDRPVRDAGVRRLRCAFRAALELLELAEIAVCGGYLQLEAVRGPLRAEVLRVLWSESAREWVQCHDRVLVRRLCTRLDIVLDDRFAPPSPQAVSAELMTAAFLSAHADAADDPAVSSWIDLALGEHESPGNDDARSLRRLIKNGRPPAGTDPDAELRAAGVYRFVDGLGATLAALPAELRRAAASLYADATAAFFGFDRRDDGWADVGTDWSAAIRSSFFMPGGADVHERNAIRRRLRQRADVLARAWADVRSRPSRPRAPAGAARAGAVKAPACSEFRE
jgi:hypothetical protein